MKHPPKKSAVKRLIKHGTVACAFVVLLLLAVLFSLPVCLNHPLVAKKIQSQVSRHMQGTLKWGKINVSYVKGAVGLDHLTLSGADQKEILHLKNVQMEWDYHSLLKGAVAVRKVLVAQVALDLIKAEDGTLNLLAALLSPEKKTAAVEKERSGMAGPDMRIGEVVLENGMFRYQDDTNGVACTLEKVAISLAAFHLADLAGKFSLTIGSGKLVTPAVTDTIQSVGFAGQMEKGVLSDLSCELISDGVRISATGRADFLDDVPRMAANALVSIDLSAIDFPRSDGLAPLLKSGRLTAKISAAGKGTSFSNLDGEAALTLRGEGLVLSGKKEDMDCLLTAALHMERGVVSLPSLRLEGLDMWLEGSGRGDLASGQLEGEAHLSIASLTNLGKFLDGTYGGAAVLKLAVSGLVQNPMVQVTADATNLIFNDLVLGDLSAAISILERRRNTDLMQDLLIKGISVRNSGARLDLEGRVQQFLKMRPFAVNPNPGIALSFKGHAEDLSQFHPEVKGTLQTRGEISGTIREPVGGASLILSDAVLAGQPLSLGEADLRLNKEKIFIEKVHLQSRPGAEVVGSGWVVPKEKQYHLKVGAEKFPLDTVVALSTTPVKKGMVDLTILSGGSWEAPTASGRVTVRDLVIQDQVAPPILLHLDLARQKLKMEAQFGLSAKGTLDLVTRNFDVAVQMAAVDLRPYLDLAGLSRFSGRADARIEASGNLGTLENVQASARINQLYLDQGKQRVVECLPSKIRFENGVGEIPGMQIRVLSDAMLSLTGTADLDKGLALNLAGDLPLALFHHFLDEDMRFSGIIRISLDAIGPFNRPKIRGLAELERVGVAIPSVETSLSDLQGRVKMTGERILLEDITGRMGDGSLRLGGHLVLAGYQPGPFEVVLSTRNLPVEIPDTLEIVLNSDLAMAGTLEKSLIQGEIVLLEGRYYKEVQIDLSKITEKKRKSAGEEQSPSPELLKQMALDIDIRSREPFRVENNFADLSVKTDLSLQGSAATPIINGRAQVEEGAIYFQKKEFEVQKGVFDFIDPYSNNPTIAIEGATEVRNWIIQLAVSGTPDNLDFSFTSSPEEQHADILSLLAFNKTTRELRKSEGGSSFSSADILAAFIAETVQEKIQKASGLDVVELALEEGATGGSAGGHVTLGKELSRQLNVLYDADFKAGETVHRVTTEYRLLEHLLMSGFQDSAGDFGGGMKYRLEFR